MGCETDIILQSKLHLDEAGLILWLATLRNAYTLDNNDGKPSLYSIFPILIDLLTTNADLLGKILSITEAYFLIDTPKLLQVLNFANNLK